MQYSLAYQLGERSGGLDPDAKAYIAAVETAGATVSGTQKSAINTFFKTGKSDGWYSSLKRLYLPIWAAAAPNAIDMITRGSGTFAGSVTHASGYVQGDGSTGYFDFAATFSTLGMTQTSAHLMAIRLTDSGSVSRCMVGARPGASQMYYIDASGPSGGRLARQFVYDGSTDILASPTGILVSVVEGTTTRIYRRGAGGLTSTTGGAIVGVIPTATNINAMRRILVFSPADQYDIERHGAWSAGNLTDAQVSPFTLSLKTLYETCTGLTLP